MRTAMNGDVELLSLRAQCFYSLGKRGVMCMWIHFVRFSIMFYYLSYDAQTVITICHVMRRNALCFNSGDLENAMKHLQQAVRSDPDNTSVRAYYRQIKEIDEKKNTADAAFKSGDNQAAVDAYSQILNMSYVKSNRPFCAKLHLNRGTAYAKLKQYDASVKDCNTAIYHNEKYIKAYLRRADSYCLLNTPEDIQRGIEDYEAAYELEVDETILKDIKKRVEKVRSCVCVFPLVLLLCDSACVPSSSFFLYLAEFFSSVAVVLTGESPVEAVEAERSVQDTGRGQRRHRGRDQDRVPQGSLEVPPGQAGEQVRRGEGGRGGVVQGGGRGVRGAVQP
jgi:tetratricopeptide (TPR) repeat protein